MTILKISTRLAACALPLAFVTGCASIHGAQPDAYATLMDSEPTAAATFVPVDPQDIKYVAKSGAPLTPGVGSLQCYGGYYTLTANETPVYGDDGAGSSELKANTVLDPLASTANAFYFATRPTDPDTAGTGSKRCEHAYLGAANAIPWNQNFWFATQVMTPDWKATTDWQSIWQWHDGSTVSGLNPFLAAFLNGDQLKIQIRYNYGDTLNSATSTTLQLYQGTWKPNVWNRFEVMARVDQKVPGNGFVKIWLNGAIVVNYKGPFGYKYAASGDYAKVGIYHWTNANNNWDQNVVKREVWVKGAALYNDRAGAGYTWRSGDALLQN